MAKKKTETKLSVDELKAIKTEIKDLVNQALILLKDIGEPKFNEDRYESYDERVLDPSNCYCDEDSDEEEKSECRHSSIVLEEQELACAKAMLKRIVDDNTIHNEDQYYNSNC